jgi:large subunit ribosomal protein L10
MPRPEKVQAVEEIRQRLAAARATFVTEYRGLTVAEQQSLRAELRKANGEYKIVKMSLARLAADAEGLDQLREVLAGPTALAFATTDPVTVAKALRDFAKEHERLIIKAGVLSGEVLPPEKVTQLAQIEPRDVLLGRIAGGFKAPLAKVAGLLQGLPRNAASVFSQLLEKKEAEPTPAPESKAQPESKPAKAEEPKAEVPKAEAEKPKAEVPKEPKAEEPKAEVPEKPTAAKPTAAKPKKPEAEEPKAAGTTTAEPKEPEAEEPKEPKAEEPKAEVPKEPKAAKPTAAKPKKPEAEEPKAAGTTTAKPKKPKATPSKEPKAEASGELKAEPEALAESDSAEVKKPTPQPKASKKPKATETKEE